MENSSQAAREGEPSANDQAHAGAPQTFKSENSAGHKRREHYEYAYWAVTGLASIVATGATVAAAIYAAGAYKATQQQVRIAQDALIASDRPWLKVLSFSDPSINVEASAVFLRARLTVKNIGRSPAQHTFVRSKLFPSGSVTDEAQEAKALCHDATAKGIPVFETLTFPDDGRDISVTTLANMRDIARDWRGQIDRDFESGRSVLGDEVAGQSRTERLAYPLRAAFTLVGCVTYVIPNGRSYGQTTFIYDINRACNFGPDYRPMMCSFEMTQPATHQGDALVVRDAISGTFAR